MRSTPGPAKDSTGRPRRKCSTSSYRYSNNPVLQRPVESGQYTSIRFTETVALEGLVASIGSAGSAYDNAAVETVMGLFKNEAITKGSPFTVGPLRTVTDVEEATIDWVHWDNNQRLHSALGNLPPEEYQRNYHAKNHGPSTGDAANKTAA